VSDYFLAKRILDGDAGYDNGSDMIEDGGDKVLNFVSVGKKIISLCNLPWTEYDDDDDDLGSIVWCMTCRWS
jgi:hypothetical protein